MSPPCRLVVGDGAAALALVASLVGRSDQPVVWLSGSRTRIAAPLAGLEKSSAQFFQELLRVWGVDSGDYFEGNTLREYKNRAFKEPTWLREQVDLITSNKKLSEALWTPELRWITSAQGRFELTVAELEDQLRQALLESDRAQLFLRRVDGVPLQAVQCVEDGTEALLGSGEKLHCSAIYFADRWSLLSGIDGLPKPLTFIRNRGPMGVLQAHFIHKVPVALGVRETFLLPLHREAGEELERHIWGYFHADGLKSTWSLCLAPEEVEDNHSIAKKFRKMKSTLDRVFTETAIVPQGVETFASTFQEEQVRFEEEAVFSASLRAGPSEHEAIALPELPGIWFLTDGFGAGATLAQVQSLFVGQGSVDVCVSGTAPMVEVPSLLV